MSPGSSATAATTSFVPRPRIRRRCRQTGRRRPSTVVANRTNPASVFAGGIAEFELTDPVVSLRGSVTADAPHLVVALDTSGYAAIRVSYLLRDLDATSANAVQPFALQYRVGGTADYANVPAAFVGDATDGPARASRVTAVEATLPPKAADRPLIEVRILTANAAGADEWVGIDEIAVAGTAVAPRDTTPPALSLVAASRQPLRRSLRKGVRVGATIGEATTLEVAARISRWLAARLALPRVVGTASVAAAEGRTRLRLRFHAPARRKLSRRTRVRLTLVARASDRAGNASRARAATVLVRQRARR